MTELTAPAALAEARRLTAGALERWGLSERAGDAALVISELAGNALRHGSGPVQLVLRRKPTPAGTAVECTVKDAGKWRGLGVPERAEVEADLDAEGGRGLFIARELADSLIVRAPRYRAGTVVTATFTSNGVEPCAEPSAASRARRAWERRVRRSWPLRGAAGS
ncbi:ATP-binding protein [Actinospica sp.]|uniref:ATP-binding protein n=1 Tax=Actinospica sp. TaxID=1872142 RepID=UPI002D11F37C|nr:ATP-binding protein [Actinospica sp.]HWG27395.1 ATP-binding protein [Actinospica sp.]